MMQDDVCMMDEWIDGWMDARMSGLDVCGIPSSTIHIHRQFHLFHHLMLLIRKLSKNGMVMMMMHACPGAVVVVVAVVCSCRRLAACDDG